MNREQMHGHLRTARGWAIERWGRVTGDPWMKIAGRREQLLGRLDVSLSQSRRIAESSFPIRQTAAGPRRNATR